MKLLVDTSFSLLFSLLLAQPALLTLAAPHNHRQLESLTNQTRNLLKLTKDLLNDHVIDTEIEHRFTSLPAMTNKASQLSSLKLKETLQQLLLDFKSFELHFEWLKQASRRHRLQTLPNWTKLIPLIKTLSDNLQHHMSKVGVTQLPSPTPSLPPFPSIWDTGNASLEVLQRFRLFCDWASRALQTLKSRN
ncbi:hypothetical protein COCON_G00004840 [Conger conger]|uniref:Interleukin-11 n=1 Tax=Conger conger TaxID=82655 RepID=A0A9Q1E1C4_CONCO|nr:uncharacterized protein il11a [Conger conger]KAJ8287825.1 hypothetical protein COCON_G00004840 [Conger conger]